LAFQISHTLNYKRLLSNSKRLKIKLLYGLEHALVKMYENKIINYFNKNLFISKHDTKLLKINNIKNDKIFYSPHGIDTNYFSQENVNSNVLQEENSILFPADFSPATNREAADWLINDIFKELKKYNPEIKLLLIGRNPPKHFFEMSRIDKNIEVSGYVKDIRPYFKRATIVVDPVRSCAGLQNKILCSLSMKRAVVATNEANEGLDIPNEIITCPDDNSSSAFVENIIFLLNNIDFRKKKENLGRKYVTSYWTWSYHFNQLEQMFLKTFDKNE